MEKKSKEKNFIFASKKINADSLAEAVEVEVEVEVEARDFTRYPAWLSDEDYEYAMNVLYPIIDGR